MERTSVRELLVCVGLISVGVGLRLQFQHLPNFAPVAALALFTGYYFRSRLLAVATPVLVMLLSDAVIGAYHPVLMAAVYGMLALPVCFRGFLRRNLDVRSDSTGRAFTATIGLIGCGLISSLAFFAVTNFATWMVGGLYEPTLAGLMRCFTQAIPFFRYTVTGDLCFAVALFGGFAVATSLWGARARSAAHA